MVRLPDQVLFEIFCNIKNAAILAKLESVCKQWHSVLRSHKSFWKNDWLDEKEASNINTKIWDETAYKRFQALLLRNGGKFNSLFLPLNVAYLKYEEIKMICRKLPTIGVQHLSISLSVDRIARKASEEKGMNRSKHIYRDKATRERIILLRAGKHVLRAIVQCSNLTTLRLSADYCISLPYEYEEDSRHWNIWDCKLESVYFSGVVPHSIFRSRKTMSILSEARFLGFLPFDMSFDEDGEIEENLWQILEFTKETLEECYLKFPIGHSIPLERTCFPRLKKLTIIDDDTSNLRLLALPKLEQLSLTGKLNLQTVTESVLSQLKQLHITINHNEDDMGYDDDSLYWTLLNCKNLEHFTFAILDDPFNCVDKVISGCDSLPLKSLTSMTPISNTALAKIFQQRFNKGNREALESLQRYGPPFSEKFVELGEEYDSWMVNHIATKLHDFGPEVNQIGSNILQKIYGLLPYDIDLSSFENVLSDLHACHY